MRRFHSDGSVDAGEHFCVERRALVEQCVEGLVGNPDEGGRSFTLWAPRQTGKTWIMRQAIAEIRTRYGDRFAIGALSMQGVLGADEGDDAFLRSVPELFREGFGIEPPAPADWNDWRRIFARPRGAFDRPLVLLIDESDALPPGVIDRLVSRWICASAPATSAASSRSRASRAPPRSTTARCRPLGIPASSGSEPWRDQPLPSTFPGSSSRPIALASRRASSPSSRRASCAALASEPTAPSA